MNLANGISIFRILLIPFFVSSLVYYTKEQDFLRFVALIIFSLSVFTDAIDGYIARIRKEETRLGTILDPLADKLLLIAAFICLSIVSGFSKELKLPLWVLIIIISRDVIIVLGAAIIHILTGNLQIAPTRVGKLTTFFQMATIISLLLQFNYSYLIWTIAVIFTVISGIDYIRRGSALLNINHQFK